MSKGSMNQESVPLSAACHCGQVRLRVAARPDYINECNCSLCGMRGAWWGYYRETEVEVTGETRCYSRTDKAEPAVAIHFCPVCGVTTHWTQTAAFIAANPKDKGWMGVNMRLFDREALAGVELRFPDGKGWDGVRGHGFVHASETL